MVLIGTPAELRQRLVKNRTRRGFFDKLHQGFDGISKLTRVTMIASFLCFPRAIGGTVSPLRGSKNGGQSAPPDPRMFPRGVWVASLRSRQYTGPTVASRA
jgi:hypothetical protein